MKDDSLSDTQLKKDMADICNKYGIDMPKYDSVGKQDNSFSPNKETNVYATQIWNDAIEAAAKLTKHSGYYEQILELKK